MRVPGSAGGRPNIWTKGVWFREYLGGGIDLPPLSGEEEGGVRCALAGHAPHTTAPDLLAAGRLNATLQEIGNIKSDGRPILGLDARNLLEILLEVDDRAFFVPAHIWTPWFSMLGSKSGFDSIEECFDDLSSHIFAAETGLSSDPSMNWRVTDLDHITLISNSDAHSPSKLGREANIFKGELNFHAMRAAMQNGDKQQFEGTFEFYPQEGKYHVDGHRKCSICFTPAQTQSHLGN